MLKVTHQLWIDESEIDYTFIRSSGPGGQNVNKVETGVQLRFNVVTSKSLSEIIRARLFKIAGNRISQSGDLLIKAIRHRTQERNKHDARQRLMNLLIEATKQPKHRKKTKPTYSSITKRIDKKKQRSRIKTLRSKKINHLD